MHSSKQTKLYKNLLAILFLLMEVQSLCKVDRDFPYVTRIFVYINPSGGRVLKKVGLQSNLQSNQMNLKVKSSSPLVNNIKHRLLFNGCGEDK